MSDVLNPQYTNVQVEALRVVPVGSDETIIGFALEDQDVLSSEGSVFFRAKAFEKATRLFAMKSAIRDIWFGGGELWAIDRHRLHRFSGTFKKAKSTALPIKANAIAGSAPDDVYLVGDGVAHFDGKKWTKLATPAKGELECVAVHGDVAYAAGRDGSLVEIAGGKVRSLDAPNPRGDDWTAIHIDGKGVLSVGGKKRAVQGPPGKLAALALPKNVAVIDGIADHAGKIYWTAVGDGDGFGVFAQNGKKLEMIDGRFPGTLSSSDRFLFAAVETAALRFDGSEWKALNLDFDEDKERWTLDVAEIDELGDAEDDDDDDD